MTKKIGLAIGGGAAWSASAIGVLKVLQQHNIKIDYLAGCSMGAMIAVSFASQFAGDQTLDQIAEILKNTKPKDIRTRNHRKSFGLFSPDKIGSSFEKNVGKLTFEQLKIPTSVVATDFKTGEEVIFNSGPVTPAIIASSALPIIFQPYEYQGKLLTDGWLSNVVPSDVVKKMGADIIIAIDVTAKGHLTRLNPKKPKWHHHVTKFIPPLHYLTTRNMPATFYQMIDLLTSNMNKYKLQLDPPDFILTPNVTHSNQMHFHLVPDHIKEGERVINEILPQLKKLLQD